MSDGIISLTNKFNVDKNELLTLDIAGVQFEDMTYYKYIASSIKRYIKSVLEDNSGSEYELESIEISLKAKNFSQEGVNKIMNYIKEKVEQIRETYKNIEENDEVVYVSDEREDIEAMSRKLYYEYIKDCYEKEEEPNLAVHVSHVYIFDTEGNIYLQKRAKGKQHNPSMWDKTIGGHIREFLVGTADFNALYREAIEESGISLFGGIGAELINSDKFDYNFIKSTAYTYQLPVYRANVKDTKKLINGKEIIVPNIIHSYIAVYDGSVFIGKDAESDGLRKVNILDLFQNLSNSSLKGQYTNDLKDFCMKNKEQLILFCSIITDRKLEYLENEKNRMKKLSSELQGFLKIS